MNDGQKDDESYERLPRWLVLSVLAISAFFWAVRLFGPRPPYELERGAFVHGLVQWSAVCASLCTAFLGWLYYRVRPNALVATIAFAALSTSLFDVLHAAASLSIVEPATSTSDFYLLTRAFSRSIEALVLMAGALFVLRRGETPPARCTALSVGLLLFVAGVALLMFTTEDLPRSLFPDARFPRPYDLVPLALFGLAGLVVFPRLHRRHPSLLSEVLLLSAIPYALAELHMALRAGNVHNADVVFAHATELVARLVPFAGISLYLAGKFQRELETSRRMEEIVEELLRVRKRFDQLTQNIREVFWISSVDGSEILYVSPAYEDIFGTSPETLYADPGAFLQLVHPDDRDLMADLTVRMVLEPFDVEYRVRRPDGELRWLQTRGFPVRDEGGEVYRVAGVTEDITEHKLAEEALRRSEARIRALFQAVPDLALRLNRGGVVLDYHGRGRIAAVPPPEEFLGKRVTDLLPELDARLGEALARALDGRAVESIEFRVERGPAPDDLEARIVRSAEDEALVLLRNITDQRRLESEVLDISHREQLRIGHDLHDGILQQLTGIALLSRVLQQQLESRGLAQHERAQQIRELVEETIGQTRSLIRGLAPVELEQGNLSAALEQLALRAERFSDVSCVCRSEDVVLDDPTVATHLYRIAQEAVSNALKHAAPSKIEISLERWGAKYRLTVRDDGTGFEPERARASNGMGLHILRYRARKVDAELEVRSAEGGGTEVTCAWTVPAGKRPASGRGLAPAPGSWR